MLSTSSMATKHIGWQDRDEPFNEVDYPVKEGHQI